MLEHAAIKPDSSVPDASDLVKNPAEGHEAASRAAKTGITIAEKNNDLVAVDLFTERGQIAEKTTWMLRAAV